MRDRACDYAIFPTVCFSHLTLAEVKQVPSKLAPDERFKPDILVVVAHAGDQILAFAHVARQSTTRMAT